MRAEAEARAYKIIKRCKETDLCSDLAEKTFDKSKERLLMANKKLKIVLAREKILLSKLDIMRRDLKNKQKQTSHLNATAN